MTVKKRTAGAQFTLFPMCDRFVEIILGALDEVDTANVEMKTDDVNTEIRGSIEDIFDVMQAVFLHAAKTGEHVALSGTAAIGCPGDKSGMIQLESSGVALNQEKSTQIEQKAGAKFSLYPLGDTDYMKKIEAQIDFSSNPEIKVTPAQGATRLDGNANGIFKTLEKSFNNIAEAVDHVSMAFTVSANSPSSKE
ncbi:YkoF family thiamine/hydroxymethylpyrimidine-binding protein [Salinicoccus sp. HZC-1]|uniref:YkoF family thiamine/hydroxymethylpyrimidine-binding protein n=1 Tax=Salinicoccus sp. HZC-1 TaxID=3385497 RepID=UPI00398B081B